MRRVLAVLALAWGVAACHSQTEVGLPTVEDTGVRMIADEAGPWKPAEAREEIRGPWRVAHGAFDERAVEPMGEGTDPFAGAPAAEVAKPAPPAVTVPEPARPAPTLAVPVRRGRVEPRPVGRSSGKSADQLARDHFLDYPTHIRGARVTLYVPPAYAGAVRLVGAQVDRSRPDRQQAVGQARLTLRELTLEGDRVVLRVRRDGNDDVQITARGGVEFVSRVRGNVLREAGLKGLFITNDNVVPLR